MKRRLLAMFLSAMLVVGMVPVSAFAIDGEPEPQGVTWYVSERGVDDSDRGMTVDTPLQTLSTAVTYANNNDTIVLLTNITATSCARISDKHLTITSAPGATYTISRDTNFATISDNNQSFYNPAIIEVTTPQAKGASVTLKDIILDDQGKHMGTYFAQTNSKTISASNTDFVQDSMVTAHGLSNARVDIILDEGAVLKNFGGMSAVYGTTNAHITMKSGSLIYDDTVTDRSKSANPHQDETGPAGVVWLQGSEFIMEQGAEIRDIVGRAVYADGGTVSIGGKISNITSDKDMWQGTGGFIVHVRNGASCTLTDGCLITNDYVEAAKASGIMFNIIQKGSYLEMQSGATIQNWNGIGTVFYVEGSANSYQCELVIDGKIDQVNTNGNHVVQTTQSKVSIGDNAEITHNKVSYGTIYIQGGNTVEIRGKINYNYSTDRGGAVAITNHGDSDVYMYDGAEMIGNYSAQTGGGLLVSDGTFTMYGGTISDNYATLEGGGVYVRQGGSFIMEGGSIENNYTALAGGGIAFLSDTAGQNCVVLREGRISGNHMLATITPNPEQGICSATGGVENDLSIASGNSANISTHMSVGDAFALGTPKIYFAKCGFSTENPANDVKFGNAATACETTIKNAHEQQNLDNIVGSLWYQTAEESLPLTIYDLKYDHTKELFAAVIETQEDGTPVSDAKAQLFTVEPDEDGNCHLVLPGGNANGYAVVFLQEGDQNAQIVKITPADITIYTGGKGYTGAVTGTSSSTDSGLPEPGFFVTLPDELDAELKAKVGYTGAGPIDLSQYISFEAETDQGEPRSWTLERYDEDGTSTVTVDGKTMYVYRLVPASDQESVRMQFTDSEDGHIIISDAFNVDMETLYQKYDMSIYTNRVDTTTIRAKVDDAVDTTRHEYLIATASGELTVRGVVDDITTDIETETPSSAEEITAVADADTKYLINGSNLEVNDPSGVKLLVDHVVEEGQTTLKDFVVENIDKITDDFQFEFRYLDLVDSANGNVWIRPDKPMTIYWPYPAGTDSSDTFYVIHFNGLDRDYDDLNAVLTEDVMQECEVQHVSGGITFKVDSFSPFVLVWKENTTSGGGTTSYTITASADTGGTIDPSGKVSVTVGSSKTFTIAAADGYEIADVLVDGKSVGAVSTYTFEKVSANHTISASFEKGLVVADPDDTGVSSWLNTKDHAQYLNGYPEGTFEPDNNMTRAEAAQMFYNLLLDQDVESVVAFSDVPADAWYAKAVNTLASLGMINGVGDNKYEPDRSITRAEFTAIAMRFAELPTGGENSFSDVTQDDWFYDEVVGSIQYGWITGYPDGTFRPNATITRAEVTTITNRMLGRSADEAYVDGHAADLRQFSDLSKTHWAYYDIMEAINAHDYTKADGAETWTALHQ